jgi:phosphatidylserine synthase
MRYDKSFFSLLILSAGRFLCIASRLRFDTEDDERNTVGIPVSANAPVAILLVFQSAQMRRSKYCRYSRQRKCAGRNTAGIPVSANAPVAILPVFLSAQMRRSQYCQYSCQRKCAGRNTVSIPVSANAPVAVPSAFLSAQMRRSPRDKPAVYNLRRTKR